MKILCVFLIICLTRDASFAQLEFKNSNLGRMLRFVDQNGHSLLKSYAPDVAGSPFLDPEWAMANITLSTGKTVGPIPVRLNIADNGLYFRDSSGTELVAVPNVVKKADCINAYWKDSVHFVFKNGYPRIDEQNENFYYQVLSEGKLELLLKAYKYVRVEKNDLSGEVSKEFVEGSKLYVYTNNSMQPLQANKNFVLLLMKDKEPSANSFIETNKVNLKKTSDLVKLFSYYNKAQQ